MDSVYSFCQTLYNCTYLPVHYYKDGQLKLSLPVTDLPVDLGGTISPSWCPTGRQSPTL